MTRWWALFGACVLAATLVSLAPGAPATHDPIVPVMETLAQNTVPGIRPGAWMESPAACTFAFVVQDQQEKLYITTAGHCVDFIGQAVTIREEGEIGRVVAFRDAGALHDYALIRLHEDKYDRVNPTMIGWGGPTGLYTGGESGIVTVKHYGWGSGTWYDHSTRCRVALANAGTWGSTFNMFSSVLWGDSGSGTMTEDGRALGINTHLSLAPWQGTSTGPRFDHALAELSSITGLELELVTGGAVNETCDLDKGG